VSTDPGGRPSDYTEITEVPGAGATAEQRARLLNRYQVASRYASGKRVVEIACGGGMGLGYLAKDARRVVGGDYTRHLLDIAHSHYAGRLPLLQLDAHALPFASGSFDLLLMFEALYYLQQPDRALREARRVLNGRGRLLLCTVNKDWSGFSPSRFSTRYFSVPEMRDLLHGNGFGDATFFGAFAATPASVAGAAVAALRRAAAALNLVPTTLVGREALKRMFYGPLAPLPVEVDNQLAPAEPLVPLPADRPVSGFKIVYATAEAR